MLVKLLMLTGFISYALLIPDQYKVNPPHAVPVLFVEPSEIDKACGNTDATVRFLACTKSDGLMILPNPCDYPEYKKPESYARTVCHEKAHINGWHHSL